ncbi:MAG: tautomerase family protein [Synergistaceae bacterium]|jgi:4-oxalocrotonate tautomerase|nr:tautomerase family protein [Synergistaceae bacterium]
MPIIHVDMIKGRSSDSKRTFATEVTELACRCFEVKPAQVRVIFHEIPRENWAVAGTLFSDKEESPSAS